MQNKANVQLYPCRLLNVVLILSFFRYNRESERHKRDPYEESNRSRADKALHDLRERLLSKRGSKADDEVGHGGSRSKSHKERRRKELDDDEALQGEAGQLVKEIIGITTDGKKFKKDKVEVERKLTEEERAEQEQRREKLLEAGKSYVFYTNFG